MRRYIFNNQNIGSSFDIDIISNGRAVDLITITDSCLLINPTILTNVSARNNGRKTMLDKDPPFNISTIDIKIEVVE